MGIKERMMKTKFIYRSVVLTFVLCVMMAACGFKPMYRQTGHNDLIAKTSKIYIAPVKIFDGARGVQLRNILLNKLTPYGKPDNPRYILDIALSEPKEASYTIKDDGTASSYLVKMSASFALKEMGNYETLLKNTVSSDISYNILKNQYSTEMLKSEAIKLAMEDIANQIYFLITTYLAEN